MLFYHSIIINSIKKSLILFVFFISTRIALEEFLRHGAFNVFDVHLHDGPIVRILEFYSGMLIIPTFFMLRGYLEKYQNKFYFKLIFTIIPLFATYALYYILANTYDLCLCRCYFILISCLYIFIIGHEFGYLSIIVSNKIIKIIMNPQMEMYLKLVKSTIIIRSIYKRNKRLFKYNRK